MDRTIPAVLSCGHPQPDGWWAWPRCPGCMRELELLRTVEVLAGRHGVWFYHPHQPQHDRAGWPDCALVGTRAAAFRELKSARGTLTPAQRAAGQRMLAAGLDWALWRPADLAGDRIEAEIAALSGGTPWPH